MADQADIDNAQKSVRRLEDDITHLNDELHGGKCDTLLNAISYIGTNFKGLVVNKKLLKVEGGYTKVQCGPSIQLVLGLKGEHIAPWNYLQILGAEIKVVLGLSTTTVRGSKSDTIIGVKADILLGTKYENHSNKKLMVGASPKATWLPWLKHKLDFFNQKAGQWATKTSEYLFKSISIQEAYDVAKETADTLTKKHNTMNEEVSKMKVTVSGEYVSRGDSYTLDYGNIYYTPGDGLYAQGSDGGSSFSVYSFGPDVSCGSTTVTCLAGAVAFQGTTTRFV